MINPAIEEMAEHTSVKHACELMGRARGSHYRAKQPRMHGPAPRRPTPPNALTEAQQAEVLGVLTSETVLRQVGHAGLGHAAGRGHLPVLDVHDAPTAARSWCGR